MADATRQISISPAISLGQNDSHEIIGRLFLCFAALAGVVSVGTTITLSMLPEGSLLGAGLSAYHGAIMMFFVVIPALFCGFGHAIMPEQIGAKSTAFPALSRGGLTLFCLGLLTALCALLVPGLEGLGIISGGQDVATPMLGSTSLASNLALAAILCGGLALLLCTINLTTTFLSLRQCSLFDVPLFSWALMLTGWMLILALPIIAAAMVAFAIDRQTGAATIGHTSDIYHRAVWFFSHPAVYIVTLPGLGLTSQIIKTHRTGAPVNRYFTPLLLLAIASLGYTLWAEQLFNNGLHSETSAYDTIIFFTLAAPIAALVIAWIVQIIRSESLTLKTPMLWALGNLALIGTSTLATGLLALQGNLSGEEIMAHFHYAIALSAAFSIFAGLYLYLPKLANRSLPEWVGRIHFAAMFIGSTLIFLPELLNYMPAAQPLADALEPWGRGLSAGSFAFFLGALGWQFSRPETANRQA